MGRTYVVKRSYLIMEEQPSSTLTRGAESNPARVLWREVTTTENIHFQIYKLNKIFLSIETDVPPVQINSELNGEGVELPFD
jgi:hypothetical protein